MQLKVPQDAKQDRWRPSEDLNLLQFLIFYKNTCMQYKLRGVCTCLIIILKNTLAGASIREKRSIESKKVKVLFFVGFNFILIVNPFFDISFRPVRPSKACKFDLLSQISRLSDIDIETCTTNAQNSFSLFKYHQSRK